MSIIDRIKWEEPGQEDLAWRWPSDNLRLGTQLIVGPSQQALFMKGGKPLDLFDSGTHTLSTNNLPLIGGMVNWIYGDKTPFAAEVWFVDTTLKTDMRWGTAGPIQVLDPVLRSPVSVRAFGQYSIRVENSRSFLLQLVGSRGASASAEVLATFRTEIVQSVTTCIASFIGQNSLSVFGLAAHTTTLSELCTTALRGAFERYGIELNAFGIARISIPEEEMHKFQTGVDERVRIEQLNQVQPGQAYGMVRQFDALDRIAETPMGGAVLLNQIGFQTSQPQDQSEIRLTKLKSLLEKGLITEAEYSTKKAQILEEL